MSAEDYIPLVLTKDQSSLPSTVQHSHRSYRRKYRKAMVRFEKEMRESNALFRDQERLYDISQRIAEQNDQILALLLELNSHPQIPPRLRYDLQDPATTRRPERHTDEQVALETLRVTRHKIQKGEVQQPVYEDLEQELLDTVEFAPKQSYADLLKGAPLERSKNDTTPDPISHLIGGFLSSKQEEAYLQALDDFLRTKSNHPRAHALGNPGARTDGKSADREREAQLRNPVSVYNWLRKNQPQVFLQDTEAEKAKVALAANRKSKRENVARAPKANQKSLEDDGIMAEDEAAASTSKGKRKRDEDGGYRPKGGNARPIKRRKGDEGKRSKRASMDISAS